MHTYTTEHMYVYVKEGLASTIPRPPLFPLSFVVTLVDGCGRVALPCVYGCS